MSHFQHSPRNHPDRSASKIGDQQFSVSTLNKTNEPFKLEKPSPEPACLEVVEPNTDVNIMTSLDNALPERGVKRRRDTADQECDENMTFKMRIKVHEQSTMPDLQQTLPLRPVKRERRSDDEDEERNVRVKKRSKVKSGILSDRNEGYTSSGTSSMTGSASTSEGDHSSLVTVGIEGLRGDTEGIRNIISIGNNTSVGLEGNSSAYNISSTTIRTHTTTSTTKTMSNKNFSGQNFISQTFSQVSFNGCNLSSCSGTSLTLTGCSFSSCNLQNSTINGSSFLRCNLKDCVIINSSFSSSNVQRGTVEGCSHSSSHISN